MVAAEADKAMQTGPFTWESARAPQRSLVLNFMQSMIIRLARPYILKDMPGASLVSRAFVQGERRNMLWRTAREQMGRSKFHPYRMRLNLRDAADRNTYFLGRWDHHETQLFIRDCLFHADVVIDIGADRGMFSLCASHFVGRSGLVICFAPESARRKLLEREISNNNIRNISLRPYGAGASEGKQVIDGIQERVVRADDHIRKLSPALVRIACKANAHDVLEGMTRTLRSGYPVVLIEIGEASNRQAIASKMAELGYSEEALTLDETGSKPQWRLAKPSEEAVKYTAAWSHPNGAAQLRRILEDHRKD